LAVVAAGPAAAAPSGQWYIGALRLHEAQQTSTGEGVTVAVIDSGIDVTRPALKGRVTSGKCFGSAKVLKPTWDNIGHGTAMAGLIAGSGTDSRHILGVAPGAKLMPLCVSGDDVTSQALFESITPAIRYAVDHGADVISMSLGGEEKAASDATVARLHAAIAYAEQHNVVVVASAGNKGQYKLQTTPSPASLPGVIAATGSNQQGGAWSKSIPGRHVALAAPAENLLTTNTGETDGLNGPHTTSGYKTAGGTSAAAALVAGTAALVRSRYPKLDAANVVNRLVKTADDKGPPGRDDTFGYGIVDPVRALTADVPTVHTNPLGELSASPPAQTQTPAPSAAAAGVGAGDGMGGGWIALIVAAVVLVVGAIVTVALATRRRRQQPAR
jgi:type VII secretion-associated serine protease mycosin